MARKVWQYHPVLGYHFIPGLKARIEHEGGGYLMRVNAAGFRCEREVTPQRTLGTKRVLIFGDSFTAGDGVSNRDRYTDLLEALLPGVEVLNFGLSGTGTDQQYLAWREYGKPIEHDLVVAAVYLENIKRNLAHFRATSDQDGQVLVLGKPYFELNGDATLHLRHMPPPKEPLKPEEISEADRSHVDWGGRKGQSAWLRSLIKRWGLRDLALKLSGHDPLPQFRDPNHRAWKLTRAILQQWARESRVPLVVCPIPGHAYVEQISSGRHYQARFAELRDTPNLIPHDPLPDFLRYAAGERRAFRFAQDPHFTPAGHRALAESLARTLTALLQTGRES
jgi:hypothetical protein